MGQKVRKGEVTCGQPGLLRRYIFFEDEAFYVSGV
jgi:hypothetical protein